jgi:hypothetical protein
VTHVFQSKTATFSATLPLVTQLFLLGLVAAPEQVTSQRHLALIQQIMGDATFLSNAGRLQQVIRDRGGFAAAADLLE